jgi:hypothetical protein
MASGDTLFSIKPQDNEPMTTAFATVDTRPDDANGIHTILDFSDAADENAMFKVLMGRNYGAAASVDVIVCWGMTSAATGDALFKVSIERCDTGTDMDVASFATAVAAAATTVPATNGTRKYTTITLTNAQFDAIVAGEWFRLKFFRTPTDAADTAAGDLELYGIEGKQA